LAETRTQNEVALNIGAAPGKGAARRLPLTDERGDKSTSLPISAGRAGGLPTDRRMPVLGMI
jgi:hypothetical protein